MAFLTITEVRRAATQATNAQTFASDATVAAYAETFFEKAAAQSTRPPPKHFDILLPHAYADKIIVAGPYAILTTTGFTVYVDWIHDRHRIDRSSVTSGNAAILRNRMGQCSSLLYATTENHSASKWMPWECASLMVSTASRKLRADDQVMWQFYQFFKTNTPHFPDRNTLAFIRQPKKAISLTET